MKPRTPRRDGRQPVAGARASCVALALGLAGASAGCTQLDDEQDDCEVFETCSEAIGAAGMGSVSNGGMTAGEDSPLGVGPDQPEANPESWSCLGGGPIEPAMATTPMITYRLPLLDWNTASPPGSLRVSLCGQFDAGCTEPPPAVTTMSLQPAFPYEVPMRAGFGFSNLMRIEVDNGATGDSAYVPAVYHFHGQVTQDTLGHALLTLTRRQLNQLAVDTFGEGAVDIEGRGLLVVRAIDCQGQRVRGVRFETNRPATDGLVPYTLVYPAQVAAWPSPDEPVYTDSLGSAGFANVPQVSVTVSGFREGDTEPYGSRTVVVVPGVMTVIEVRPSNFLKGQ